MNKSNFKYFIIGSMLVLVLAFLIMSFWRSYWRTAVIREAENFRGDYAENYRNYFANKLDENGLEISGLSDDPLITSAGEVYKALVKKTDPIRGGEVKDLNRKLLIVEFGDFSDEVSRTLKSDMDKILATYKDQIIFVWKDFPLGVNSESRNASLAARCAQDQSKFWDYYDLLFEQRQLGEAIYFKLAEDLGLEMDDFKRCYESKDGMDLIGENMTEALDYEVGSIPYLFVGEKVFQVEEGYNFDALNSLVKSEIVNFNK